MDFARVQLSDGRKINVGYRYLEKPNGTAPVSTEVERPAVSGEAQPIANLAGKEAHAGEKPAEEKPVEKYKFGSTQANIPDDSEAGKALAEARSRIAKSDLGSTAFGGDQTTGLEDHPHVTLRYGIKGDDLQGVRDFLAQQKPFEATLGKLASFPPSEQIGRAHV